MDVYREAVVIREYIDYNLGNSSAVELNVNFC